MRPKVDSNSLSEQDLEFFRALCEPARLDILMKLAKLRRADIAAIAAGGALDRSVVSRHLKVLRDANIVVSRREGRHRYYEINGAAVVQRLEHATETMRALVEKCCPAIP